MEEEKKQDEKEFLTKKQSAIMMLKFVGVLRNIFGVIRFMELYV